MMSTIVSTEIGNLRIANVLYDLVRSEMAPGTGLDPDAVWEALGRIVADLGGENRRLLDVRDRLQESIDGWHEERSGQPIDPHEYREFLTSSGYLVPEGGPFRITTHTVDPEISSIAGPQLVVPVDNARYALNATNARWGSLYDALYGSNAIPEADGTERGAAYDPVRGSKVVAETERFLDAAVPLGDGRYSEVNEFSLSEGDGHKRLGW